MSAQVLKDSFGWGFILWLVGYVMGIGLFFVVLPSQIGWVILPVGVLITVWVLLTKIHGDSLQYYIMVAVVWTAIATSFLARAVIRRRSLACGSEHPADMSLYDTRRPTSAAACAADR